MVTFIASKIDQMQVMLQPQDQDFDVSFEVELVGFTVFNRIFRHRKIVQALSDWMETICK